MVKIGLIREGKIPADNRVALTPAQCKWILKNSDEVKIYAQPSSIRCFNDREYQAAGVVGAHNGMMAYGNRTGLYKLDRVYKQRSFRELIHNYFGLRLPNVKIAITGSGRVAHGVLEIMNLMGIHEVEPDEYLKRRFSYPVYTQLKGVDLYEHKETGKYSREDFHNRPQDYNCKFLPYAEQTDILMNGVFWDVDVPRLFEKADVSKETFIIQTIADITDDKNGSIPINLGDQAIDDPIYGVDKNSFEKTAPYLNSSIDIMAVGNLPNELPRDASRYFGEQLIKYVLEDIVKGGSEIIDRATMVKQGKLTKPYEYLSDYVNG